LIDWLIGWLVHSGPPLIQDEPLWILVNVGINYKLACVGDIQPKSLDQTTCIKSTFTCKTRIVVRCINMSSLLYWCNCELTGCILELPVGSEVLSANRLLFCKLSSWFQWRQLRKVAFLNAEFRKIHLLKLIKECIKFFFYLRTE